MAESMPNATSSSSTPTTTTNASGSSGSAPSLPQSFEFPSYLPTPPFINISGIPNFRDIGGYLTATSYLTTRPDTTKPMMVRKNLIYRCAHPQLLTPEGNRQLTQDHNIKHIYDLRSAPEVQKLSASISKTSSTDAVSNPHSKALQPDGITRYFTPVYEESDYSPAALAKKVGWYTSYETKTHKLPYAYSEGFVEAYRDIALYGTISSRSCPSHNAGAYPTIIRQILAHPDEPIVFHCTAGKDRTGVFVGILLKLAGVDDETIAWEYALTEPGLGSWRRLFIDRIAKTGMGGAGHSEDKTEGGSVDENGQTSTKSDTNNDAPVPNTSSSGISAINPSMTRQEAARIVGARSGNMRAFLKLILDGEFGGVEKYLVTRCGLRRDEIERLREILVVPVIKVEDVVPVMAIRIQGWSAEGGVRDEDGEGNGEGKENGKVDGDDRALPLNEEAGRETELKVMAG